MKFGKSRAERIEICMERKPHRSGWAGLICSPLFRRNLSIIINEDLLDRLGVNNGFITTSDDGSMDAVIMTRDVFDGFKQGKAYCRLFLFHEIGHFVRGHLDSMQSIADESEMRIEYIRNGSVPPRELEADMFAVKYLGTQTVLCGLRDGQEQRSARDMLDGVSNDETSIAALREYDLRIAAIEGEEEE